MTTMELLKLKAIIKLYKKFPNALMPEEGELWESVSHTDEWKFCDDIVCNARWNEEHVHIDVPMTDKEIAAIVSQWAEEIFTSPM